MEGNWLQWAEETSLANIIRQSFWLYPGLEIIHILGIALLVGAAIMFDLRLLGYAKSIPVAHLGDHLLSWSQKGLWLILPSGLLLFITNAESLGNNPIFWIKISMILIGGLNALIFHQILKKKSMNDPLPNSFKLTAVVSIIVWICVIACGRLLAY